MHLDTKKKRESKSLELGWKFARWREEQNFYFGQERDCSGLFLHLFFFSPPPLRTKSWSWPATPSWLALEWNSRPIAATSRFSFFLPPLPLYIYIYSVYSVIRSPLFVFHLRFTLNVWFVLPFLPSPLPSFPRLPLTDSGRLSRRVNRERGRNEKGNGRNRESGGKESDKWLPEQVLPTEDNVRSNVDGKSVCSKDP